MKKMILGLAIALALVASAPAHAATVAELQAEIDALLAQLSGLSGGSSSSSCYAFTRDLTVGVSGADVTELQNYLAAKGYFSVAATGYFGAITQASVAAWQSANGVAPAAGYFGAISRAKYNSMCTTSGGGSTGGDDDDDDSVSGGEADLNNFDGSSGSDSDVEEGDEAEVYEFEFDVDDADAEIERVDVMFKSTGADGDDEPWEVFDEITLLLDGEEVGSEDGSDEDMWDEDADDEYRIRFTGVDTVVDEDSTPEFTVVVSTQNNIDDIEDDVSWTIWIPEEGVRALDGEGIDHTIGDDDTLASAADEAEFDIDVAGQGEELTVSESDNNPDATVLELEDDERSDWMTVLTFTLEAEDNDIEISELPVFVDFSGATTTATFINDVMLVIDGEEFDDFTWSATNLNYGTTTFEFDNEELVVGDGEEIEVEFMLEFNALDLGDEGTTVTASLTSEEVDAIEAEGADDLTAGQLKGSATGDDHTLRTDGVSLAAGDLSAEVVVVDEGGDRGEFTIEFEVTAFGEDFYIPFGAATSTQRTDQGVSYDFVNGDNDVVAGAGTTTASLDSSAEEDDNAFVVREGDTETFTLEVTYDPTTVGTYKVLLQNVYFRLEGIADSASTAQAALPESDYRTGSVNIVD
jgi:hypothetical protein